MVCVLVLLKMRKVMKHEVSLSFLNGSRLMIQNGFNSEQFLSREPRNIKGVFFAPYESKQEFIYCARHTLLPALIMSSWVLNPINFVIVPAVLLTSLVTLFIIEKISESLGATSFEADANYLVNDGSQFIVDLLVLPASSLLFLTRSLSSILEKTGIINSETNESTNTMLPN